MRIGATYGFYMGLAMRWVPGLFCPLSVGANVPVIPMHWASNELAIIDMEWVTLNSAVSEVPYPVAADITLEGYGEGSAFIFPEFLEGKRQAYIMAIMADEWRGSQESSTSAEVMEKLTFQNAFGVRFGMLKMLREEILQNREDFTGEDPVFFILRSDSHKTLREGNSSEGVPSEGRPSEGSDESLIVGTTGKGEASVDVVSESGRGVGDSRAGESEASIVGEGEGHTSSDELRDFLIGKKQRNSQTHTRGGLFRYRSPNARFRKRNP